MIRLTALLLAVALAGVTVTSACIANASSQRFTFTLDRDGGADAVQARFRHHDGSGNHLWTSSFREAQLAGFDGAAFRAPGAHGLRFAIDRDSGRLDCSGEGGSSRATGECGFASSPAFAARLGAAGVAAPSADEWLELFALDVRPALLEAIHAAGYPAPSVDELVEMTAVGVDAAYIQTLARHGYRPEKLGTLVELKAVGVDPRWLGEMASVGYTRLPIDGLAELRALGVDAAYIRGFQQAGYRNLSPDDLVQLKALGVTADYARRIESSFGRQSPERLVELKALGIQPRAR